MYEHIPHNTTKVPTSSDRTFEFVFASVFLIIAFVPLVHAAGIRLWAVGVSGALMLLAGFAPQILSPANRSWTKLGFLLHKIVSPIALLILFFIVVTPTGILMRLFGKDPLNLHFDPAAKSYWIKREIPGPETKLFYNQF